MQSQMHNTHHIQIASNQSTQHTQYRCMYACAYYIYVYLFTQTLDKNHVGVHESQTKRIPRDFDLNGE